MKYKFLILILTFSVISFAQQLPQYSGVNMLMHLNNPSFISQQPNFEINSFYRNQWAGFENAPKSFFIEAHTSLKASKHYLGGYLYSDDVGLLYRKGLGLEYAYLIEIGEGRFLSSGLSFALNSSGIKFNELKLGEQNDPLTVEQENLSTTIPDFNIGISYFSKKVFLGLSSNQVIANSKGISKDNLKDSHSRHFYFDIGANFKYQSFNFIPIINLKYATFSPFSSLIMIKTKYRDKIWINMAYRLQDSFIFGVGTLIKEKVAVEYNFDLTTSKLNSYNNGTHELVLKVILGNKKIESNPSFY